MTRVSKKAQKPAVALSKVPSVKELCEQLGFQRASIKEMDVFLEATRTWRKTYKTSDGSPGSDLLRWNDPLVQLELRWMAENFVQDNGNGDRFWGPSRNWYDDSDVQFPEETGRIVELLMQLFWKQNKYAQNNLQYGGGHKQTETREGSRQGTTPSRESAHPTEDAFDFRLGPDIRQAIPTKSGEIPNQQTTITVGASDPIFEQQQSSGSQTIQIVDVFEVPDDSDPATAQATENTKKRVQTGLPVGDTDHRKRKKYSLGPPPRRTDRKRNPVERPGIVPTPDEDDIVEDRPRTPRSPDLLEQVTWLHEGHPSSWRDSSKDDESSRMTTAANKTFAAPTAPMIDGEKSASPSSSTKPSRPLQTPSEQGRVQKKKSPPSKPQTGNKGQKLNSPPGHQMHSKSPHTKVKSKTPIRSSSDERKKASDIESDIRKGITDLRKGITDMRKRRQMNCLELEKEWDEDFALSQPPTSPSPTPRPRQLSLHEESPASPGGVMQNLEEMESFSVHRPTAEVLQRPPTALDNISNFLEKPNYQSYAETATGESRDSHAVPNPSPKIPIATPIVQSAGERTTLTREPAKGQGTIPIIPSQQTPAPTSEIQQTSSEPSIKPRQKTQIPLWIITREGRDSRYCEERWNEGKLSGHSLPTFLSGISQVTQRHQIEKIKLTLRTATSDTKITVFKDEEDSWVSAREAIIEKIKEAKSEARARRQNEMANIKILVEPFYEENLLPSGVVDEDEEDFEV